MPYFKKKPVEIEAEQFTGTNQGEIADWMRRRGLGECAVDTGEGMLLLTTLEGTLEASPGDWIIRGVKGEYYPCKADIFEATYDRVIVTNSLPPRTGTVWAVKD